MDYKANCSINLNISEGEIHALLGENGARKIYFLIFNLWYHINTEIEKSMNNKKEMIPKICLSKIFLWSFKTFFWTNS